MWISSAAVPQSANLSNVIYFSNKIFNRWRHILFWKWQFTNPNPNRNPKPNPKPNPKRNPDPNLNPKKTNPNRNRNPNRNVWNLPIFKTPILDA